MHDSETATQRAHDAEPHERETVHESRQGDDAHVEPAPRRRGGTRRRLLQRATPTFLLVLFCVCVGIPVTVALAPAQDLTIAGQHVSVDVRPPSLSLSGPAQLVQIGNTQLDITPLRVFGPLRPRLTLGPVQRNAAAAAAINPGPGTNVRAEAVSTLSDGLVRWYGWATVILLGFTVAAIAGAGYIRILVTLRRSSRHGPRAAANRGPLSVIEIWQNGARQFRSMTLITVLTVLVAWAGSGWLAYVGTAHGMRGITSLADLVGTYHVTPSPVGPAVRGFTGAVIGDSRAARVGGPGVVKPTADDTACARSADSLAAELGSLTGGSVLNLACSGASVAQGLRGPQEQGGRLIAPQVGRLLSAEGLKYVVVMIGPNDLNWTDLLRYCYAVDNCQDNLTQGEFEYRLAAFDRDYGDLLQDLNDLPDRPQIIVVTSYDVFTTTATCVQAEGSPPGHRISNGNVALLTSRNNELNGVLETGAQKYGFTVADPRLTPLCTKAADGLGPDIQGLTDPQPFHPTALGSLRIAAAVAAVLKPTS